MTFILEGLEALLAITIIVLVAVNGAKLLYTVIYESLSQLEVNKEAILHSLDIALLLVPKH